MLVVKRKQNTLKSVLGNTVSTVNFIRVRPLNSSLYKLFCNTSSYEADSAYRISFAVSCYSPDQSVSADGVIKLNKLVQSESNVYWTVHHCSS